MTTIEKLHDDPAAEALIRRAIERGLPREGVVIQVDGKLYKVVSTRKEKTMTAIERRKCGK